MRNSIHTLIFPLFTFIFHLPYPPVVTALDLRCASLDVPRFRIDLDSNLTIAPDMGEWCCPVTYPIHGSSYISKWTNPPEFKYADASGTPYTKFPACFGCGNDEHVCETTGGVLSAPSNYVCCPSNYTCGSGDRKCYGMSPDGVAIIANGDTHIVEVAAVPVADFDLCRFHRSSNGSSEDNTTMVEGSPCDSLFKCEAYSQSQYRCTTCADSRYSPPGDCKTFTCPCGRYCSNTTNAYGAAPFTVVDALCPIGSYCPVNSTSPILCRASAGEYCPYAGMGAAENCNSWTGVATYCPVDSLNKEPCPVGYYCSAFSLPHPCPEDQFSDVAGVFQCQSCSSPWYTSDSGATKCSKLKPLPIVLICLAILLCIASVYLTWYVIRRRKLQAIQREFDKEATEAREKVIAAHEAQVAAAAINIMENKRKKAEAIRFQFQKECGRIKAGVLERFMGDFRVELAKYAQSLSFIDAQPEGITMEMEQEGFSSQIVTPIDDELLHSYEVFVMDFLSREFDMIATPASQVIRFMTEQPESVCPRDFDQKMKRIHPLILESLPGFLTKKQAAAVEDTTAAEGVGESFQLSEGATMKQAEVIRQGWSLELQQHMSLWLKQHGVAMKYSPSPSYNQAAAAADGATTDAVATATVEISKSSSSSCSVGRRALFQPLPPSYRPTLFPLSDEGGIPSSVRRTRLPRSANSSPPLLESSGSATPATPVTPIKNNFSSITPRSSPSPPKKAASFVVQIAESNNEEVQSESHSLSSVRLHLSE